MRIIWPVLRQLLVLLPWLVCLPANVEAAGLMMPVNSQFTPLQIQQHHVEVVIEDGYAITHIDQTFFNPNKQILEALYTFPVPEKAAVGEFTYWIDDRPVSAEVLPKVRAREIYAQEKAQGRETALLEQDKYRSFDVQVYPVLPQQSVRVRLVYIQAVHSDLGIGRYVYPLAEGGVDEQRLAFWNYNDVVEEAFSFKLSMRSAYPLDTFLLPKHPQAQITRQSDREWAVDLSSVLVEQAVANQSARADVGEVADMANAELSKISNNASSKVHLNQDVVVYWRHQQGLPGSVDMVTYREPGSHRGTFMMTVTPGDDLTAVAGGRDWIFVLDYSGSMAGKYQSLVEGVREGLSRLPAGDRFRLILFNDKAWELSSAAEDVHQANIEHYLNELESILPDGGTNLYAGLKLAYKHLDVDRASAVVLVTDGVANVGATEKRAFWKLLAKHDVRLFSFAMGNSANRPLLESLSRVSNGFAMNISTSDDISGRLLLVADKLSHEAYRDIEVDIDGVRVKDLTPARIGSLYRGQQLVLLGHYWGEGSGRVTIRGRVGDRHLNYQSPLQFPGENTRNPELERLWAFASIEVMQNQMDYLGQNPDTEQAITDLAVEYALVTDYTSMIVVRDEVFEQYQIERNNADRVQKEQTARIARTQSDITPHRQDSAQPAFSGTRAYPRSGSGSGAIGPWNLLMLLLLVLAGRRSLCIPLNRH